MFTDSSREFQKGIDAETQRRLREDGRLQLRKKDREERLKRRREDFKNKQKKENVPINNNNNNNNKNLSGNQNQNDQDINAYQIQAVLEQLPQLVQGCFTNHLPSQFECAQRIRKLLSIEKNPPIQKVIESGVIPRLVQFLGMAQFPKLQFEAAWALTNIASGTAEHTAAVIKYTAIPAFINLLNNSNIEVVEQAIWALGNIAGDSPECRNLVLDNKALDKLLPLCQLPDYSNDAQLSLLRNATWTLSNFCRGKPQPLWKFAKDEIKALTVLLTVNDSEVLQDACWAFSYLSDAECPDDNQKIEAIVNSGALARLIDLLGHSSPQIQHPALRTIGNIVTGDDKWTNTVIQQDGLKQLGRLLDNERQSLKKEACWTISNITAGAEAHIQCVIGANLIQPLIKLLKYDKFDVQKEACWALSNATSGGNSQQIAFLVHQGIIPALIQLLNCKHLRAIAVAMEGLENIFKSGQSYRKNNLGRNPYTEIAEEAGIIECLDKIQALDDTPEPLFKKAANILQQYYHNDIQIENLHDEIDNNNNNNSNNNNNMNNNNNNNRTNNNNNNNNIRNNNNNGNNNKNNNNNNNNNRNNNNNNNRNNNNTNNNNSNNNNNNGGNNDNMPIAFGFSTNNNSNSNNNIIF